ncbi:MAG: hypothetical protein AAF203_07075 [Pseudomonadota bacterium]
MRIFIVVTSLLLFYWNAMADNTGANLDAQGRQILIDPKKPTNFFNTVGLFHGEEGYVLELDGTFPLAAGTGAGFLEALDAIPKDTNFTVVLNSGGGSILLAENYFRKEMIKKCRRRVKTRKRTKFIKTCRIKTLVKAHSECSSACLAIFLAGDDRFLDENAKLGFHTAQTPFSNSWPRKMARHLRKWGADSDWTIRQRRLGTFDDVEMTYFNGFDLLSQNSGIVTKVIEKPIEDLYEENSQP